MKKPARMPRKPLAPVAPLLLAALIAFTLVAPVAALAASSSSSDYTVNGQPGTLDGSNNLAPTNPSGNTVTVTDGGNQDPRIVYGGHLLAGSPGDVTGNTVTVSGGAATGVYGGSTDNGTAAGNRVSVSGGDLGDIYGGSAQTGTATGNSVTINGGKVGNVRGGHSQNGSATNNNVTINGGNMPTGAVFGGSSANSGNATGNSVSISGGTFGMSAFVFGGSASDSGGNATGNSVTISGGTFSSMIIAGGQTGNGGNATGNTVTILGNPAFSTSGTFAGTALFGGYSQLSAADLRTGNTLNVLTSGITVRNIANFQNYNFAMSPTNGATLLTLTDTTTAPSPNTVFAAGDMVRVVQVNGGQRLAVGHSNTLLAHTGNGVLSGLTAAMLPSGQIQQGASLLYDYALAESADHKSLAATITGVQAAPQGKALSEGRAAALGYALLGADLVAGAGMDNARTVTSGKGLSGGSAGGMGLMPFFAMSASSMRYNSGSYTDVNGMALMAGLAKKWEAPAADVLLGAFFEAGFGSYNTHNSFGGFGSVDGNGNIRNTGGGVLARVDMTDTALKGLYAEASFRVGGLFSDFRSGDLRDMAGNSAAYDLSSTYYGAHAGLGYIWQFNDKAALDVYGKYFWTHQTGQDVTVLGDKFSFKDMDSQRIRLGGRFSYAVTEGFAPYAGAAWEYEFDGKARATTYGLDVPAPSLKGSTGVGELGISWKPANATGFSVDLGMQGFTGQREGVSGNLMLKYEF